MNLHIPIWLIPIILTAAIWVVAVLWPIQKGGGDYNFGPAFDALAHGVIAVVATLILWLVFFAAAWSLS